MASRHSRTGLDLNREFWCVSNQPEVRSLEAQLRTQRYDVTIALNEDDTSDGLYGFVRGAIPSEHLLEPALAAASRFLPRNLDDRIDGFAAEEGIIREEYTGILSALPEQRPHALEIVFETPGLAPPGLRTRCAVLAVQTILAEYRKLLTYGTNLYLRVRELFVQNINSPAPAQPDWRTLIRPVLYIDERSSLTQLLALFLDRSEIATLVVLRPSVRYCRQTAADYYAESFQGNPDYYSSDYRVSAEETLNLGLQMRIQLIPDKLALDLGYERYMTRGTDGSTSQSAYPDAHSFTAGIHYQF